MRTIDVAHVVGVAPTNALRSLYRAGLGAPIGSGQNHVWSPGDALAVMVLHQLEGREVFAEGARKCGEALDSGYPPAYLVTRGGCENVVVIETDDSRATDEMVAALLMQATDAGAAVRIVRLRPLVAKLEPFLRELVDA